MSEVSQYMNCLICRKRTIPRVVLCSWDQRYGRNARRRVTLISRTALFRATSVQGNLAHKKQRAPRLYTRPMSRALRKS